MAGLIVVFGAIAIPLLGNAAKGVGGFSQAAAKTGSRKTTTSIPYNPMIQSTSRVQDPLIQETPKVEQKTEVEVPSPQKGRGLSAAPRKSEQDILKSLPRKKLPNGKCPNEQFLRLVPEGGGRMGGLPLSDCEPYPEDAIHQDSIS